MRVVFMGTPVFAVNVLDSIINGGHEVVAVFTRKDAPKNRKMKLFPPPVKEYAEKRGIDVYQPASLKNDKWIDVLNSIDFDVIVVAAYGKILPLSVLSLPKYGCINVHASLLPKYRGASPINASLLNGDSITGVSIMKMNEGLDTGDIILKKEIQITERDCFDTLHDKLSIEGGRLLLAALDMLESKTASYQKQDDTKSSYAPLINNSDTALDFKKDAFSVVNKIRAFDSVPGAFCLLDGLKTKLYSARLMENESINMPGEILKADKNGIVIACSKGTFKISEIQLSGGKRMPVQAFLSGHKDIAEKSFSSGI